MNFTKLMKPLIAFCLLKNADYANSPALGQRLHPPDIQRFWRFSPHACFHASAVRHWIHVKKSPRAEVTIQPAQVIPSHSASTTTDNTLQSSECMDECFIRSDTESLSSMVQEATYSCRRQIPAYDEKLERAEANKIVPGQLHWHKRKLTSLANTCYFPRVRARSSRSIQRSKMFGSAACVSVWPGDSDRSVLDECVQHVFVVVFYKGEEGKVLSLLSCDAPLYYM